MNQSMDSKAITRLVLEALEEVKAVAPVLLDVREQTDITDYMLVASGSTNRQVKALAARVIDSAKTAELNVIGVEGLEDAGWVLIDLGDVLVHVMLPPLRELYDLESLWSLVPTKSNNSYETQQQL